MNHTSRKFYSGPRLNARIQTNHSTVKKLDEHSSANMMATTRVTDQQVSNMTTTGFFKTTSMKFEPLMAQNAPLKSVSSDRHSATEMTQHKLYHMA